jgi:hypothetical protein
MWSPQTIIRVSDSSDYNTHFAAYGLGWRLSDYRGYKQVGHSGSLAGIVTMVTLIPELKLGIIVFTNQQSGDALRSITNSVLDRYFGIKGIDRIKQYNEATLRDLTNAKKIADEIWKDVEAQQQNLTAKPDYTIYTGTYTDSWFGEIIISEKNGKLWFDSKRSTNLSGQMVPFKGNTFIVKWNDRSLDADAYVMFNLDISGKAFEIKMKAISPLTDFSYDFHDLNFKR